MPLQDWDLAMNLQDICSFLHEHSSKFRTAWATSADKFKAGVECGYLAKTTEAKTVETKDKAKDKAMADSPIHDTQTDNDDDGDEEYREHVSSSKCNPITGEPFPPAKAASAKAASAKTASAKTASAKAASAKTAPAAAASASTALVAAAPTAVARPDTELFLGKIKVFETKGDVSKYAATKLWAAFVHHHCQDNRSVDTLQRLYGVMVRVAHGKGFFVRDLARLIGAGSGRHMTRWLENNVNLATYPSLQAVMTHNVSLYL